MDIFLKIVKNWVGNNFLEYTTTKMTFGAPGPEKLDIRSAVPFVILIWATKFLYTKFG